MVNLARQASHLPPVTLDATLTGVAQAWAVNLAKYQVLMHGDFAHRLGVAFPRRACGECVAEGQETGTLAVRTLLADGSHRAIILGAQYTICGVGVASSPGSRNGLYWVIDFVQ